MCALSPRVGPSSPPTTMVALPAAAAPATPPLAPPAPGSGVAVVPAPGVPPSPDAPAECSAAEHPMSPQKLRRSQDGAARGAHENEPGEHERPLSSGLSITRRSMSSTASGCWFPEDARLVFPARDALRRHLTHAKKETPD